MTMDDLIEGMAVWYVMQEGEHVNVRRVAIVRRITNKTDGTVDLMVMPEPGDLEPDQLFFRKEEVKYSKKPDYYTWHFIEK